MQQSLRLSSSFLGATNFEGKKRGIFRTPENFLRIDPDIEGQKSRINNKHRKSLVTPKSNDVPPFNNRLQNAMLKAKTDMEIS